MKKITRPIFFSRILKISGFVFLSLAVWIQPAVYGTEDQGGFPRTGQAAEFEADQQAGVLDAQATMASLFGRGAVMPVPSQMAGGTLALPSFDSSHLEIDKNTIAED